jgi:integrase
VRWCRSEDGPGYNDARQIDRRTLQDYAAYLRQQIQHGELCIATAQNRLSSVNRTLAALRGDQNVRVASPSQALGQQRSSVRTRAPDGQNYQQVRRVLEVLGEQQHERVAAIVLLARATRMRLREAILADLPRLHREAEHLGRINIQDGTKGGRSGASAPRWVVANAAVKAALQLARDASPTGSRNLLARDESYAVFLQQTVLPAREALHAHGLKGFHELRAAYACERYEQLTGHAAPVNGGHCYRLERDLDQQARQQISLELGHNRIDVMSAYIGGRV